MGEQIFYIAISWVYFAITLCLVLNRLYVRKLRLGLHSERKWAAICSDGLVVIAWIFIFPQRVCDIVMYTNGALVQPGTATDEHARDIFNKAYFVENILFYIPLYFIKGAILCFLLEVTPSVLKGIRRAIWAGIGLSILGLLYMEFIFTFPCFPDLRPSYNTDLDVSQCKAATTGYGAGVYYHVATDLYMLMFNSQILVYTIPFFIVNKLQIIKRSEKLAILGMFSAGFILVCFTIPQILVAYNLEPLIMYSFWWCIHEQNMAVVVACLPALRVTLQNWYRSYKQRSNEGIDLGGRRRTSIGVRLRRGELSTREVINRMRSITEGTSEDRGSEDLDAKGGAPGKKYGDRAHGEPRLWA